MVDVSVRLAARLKALRVHAEDLRRTRMRVLDTSPPADER